MHAHGVYARIRGIQPCLGAVALLLCATPLHCQQRLCAAQHQSTLLGVALAASLLAFHEGVEILSHSIMPILTRSR